MYVLILAGGSGTRLWPLSRGEMPKQFLPLVTKNSLFQDTLRRSLEVTSPEKVLVVAGAEWRSIVTSQAGQVMAFPPENFLEEPVARNTCGAIALGCASLRSAGASDDDSVLVCPSDHVIADVPAYRAAVEAGKAAAEKGDLVVFGIPPTGPETGFGYVEADLEGADRCSPVRALPVLRFVEKPSLEKAREYVEQGNFYWNGGMFLSRVGTMMDALVRYQPEIGEKAIAGVDTLRNAFASIPSISLDYAVMEKAENVSLVPLDAGWSDVGSWDAVYDMLQKDENSNASTGDAVLSETEGTLVVSSSRLVVTQGVKDLIVVETPDAVEVLSRGASQNVRTVVERLKKEHRRELTQTPSSVRPWGSYHILGEAERYKIKRIVIEPGKRLSLQYHLHRSEHWVVVRGTAWVSVDGRESFVHEGQSVFIPKGGRHRLGNQGKIPLEIIEVQCGEYVGEDDIVRVTDDFQRAEAVKV